MHVQLDLDKVREDLEAKSRELELFKKENKSLVEKLQVSRDNQVLVPHPSIPPRAAAVTLLCVSVS